MRRLRGLQGLFIHEWLHVKGSLYMMGIINIVALLVVLYHFRKGSLEGSAYFILMETYVSLFTTLCCNTIVAERQTKWYEYVLATPLRASEYITVKYIANLLGILCQRLCSLLVYLCLKTVYTVHFDAGVILFFALAMTCFFALYYPFMFGRYKTAYVIMFVFAALLSGSAAAGFVISASSETNNLSLRFAGFLSGIHIAVWVVVVIAILPGVFLSYKSACKKLEKLVM